MRHLTDEELAKYFDDGTQDMRPGSASNGGWSLDDAFANPKMSRASEPKTERVKTVVRTSAPEGLNRPESRATELPLLNDDLTWTGRDIRTAPSGIGKTPLILIGALVALALIMMMSGGDTVVATGNLPQIGR